jgi:(2Fe-2S) ferredoxin
MDHVARLGGDWYSRVTKESLFQVAKPLTTMGIGVDVLPDKIKNSKVLTGNNLGQLGNVEVIPTLEDPEIIELQHLYGKLSENQIHLIAKEFLDNNNVIDAWKLLISSIN